VERRADFRSEWGAARDVTFQKKKERGRDLQLRAVESLRGRGVRVGKRVASCYHQVSQGGEGGCRGG